LRTQTGRERVHLLYEDGSHDSLVGGQAERFVAIARSVL
jgi:hypothetical protein